MGGGPQLYGSSTPPASAGNSGDPTRLFLVRLQNSPLECPDSGAYTQRCSLVGRRPLEPKGRCESALCNQYQHRDSDTLISGYYRGSAPHSPSKRTKNPAPHLVPPQGGTLGGTYKLWFDSRIPLRRRPSWDAYKQDCPWRAIGLQHRRGGSIPLLHRSSISTRSSLFRGGVTHLGRGQIVTLRRRVRFPYATPRPRSLADRGIGLRNRIR